MVTLFLATIIGWYLVIVSLFLLSRPNVVRASVQNAITQHGLMLVIAFITLILGLLMVVSHNVWVMGWPVVVTLFAWLILIIGLLRLFCPDVTVKMGQGIIDYPNRLVMIGVVSLIIGLFLLFMVYFG